MKLFVTGATGALGAPVTRRLVAAGHDVGALSRSDGNRARLTGWGDTAVEADLFARSQRVSNRRFCTETGWRPSVPDQRQGWSLMAGAAEPPGEPVPPVRASQTAGPEAG